MPFQPGDFVRIVKPGVMAMIESYIGSDAVVLDKHPELPLYTIEIDTGRIKPDRGGQNGPRFVVREDMIEPDISEIMLATAAKVMGEYDDRQPIGTEAIEGRTDLAIAIYRAMRSARYLR